MDEVYIVYVKTDGSYVTDVNSSAFLRDTGGWTEIDRGEGLRYHHAQGNYFPHPIRTEGGAWQYKLENGAVTECSADEIAEQESRIQESTAQSPGVSEAERIAELEEALELLLSGVTE